MIVASWNIQNGKGVDNVISLARIAEVTKELCDPDVICLQEVSRNLPLSGPDDIPDQIAQICELFPGYEAIFGSAVEAASAGTRARWQFGNVTLTRLPVLSVFHHPLPQPAEPGAKHMPRQAIELTVKAARGPVRIFNTHFEFHSARQRLAQVQRLREIYEETVSNTITPPSFDGAGPYQFVDRAPHCVMCGDFNMEIDSPEYAAMIAPLPMSGAAFLDAWPLKHGSQPHAPTCGVHDHVQWPMGSHCRDFFFISESLKPAVRELRVDTQTKASDHQPMMLQLAED